VAINSVALLGVGTLGGFIAESLAYMNIIKRIVLIDGDIVEEHNIKKSIYRKEHIGKKKVFSLKSILSALNPDLIIEVYDSFVEENFVHDCDIVIDCRDVTYNRGNIPVRAYISSRYLIIDCRTEADYETQFVGRYIENIEKEELRYASTIVSMLISNKIIDKLIQSRIIQKYDLDQVKQIEEKECIAYEPLENNKIYNLPEKATPILNVNKEKDLNVFVGSRRFPLFQTVIPARTLNSLNDVNFYLNNIVFLKLPCSFPGYIISINDDNSIELIPESSAA